ncbi:hypothetical protein DF186_15950, partial [Enterococcus hirae]
MGYTSMVSGHTPDGGRPAFVRAGPTLGRAGAGVATDGRGGRWGRDDAGSAARRSVGGAGEATPRAGRYGDGR